MNLFWYDSFNFGDMLSPYLLSKIKNVPIESIHTVNHDDEKSKYIITGSILSCPQIKNACIFGAGFVYSNNYFTGHNITVKGVRGNLTLSKINYEKNLHGNSNIHTDGAVVGEPSLLLPRYFQPISKPIYELGIVPHIFDYKRACSLYEKDALVIDLRKLPNETITQCVERVITQICMCQKTVSSSLHGLIVSSAYNISTDWCKFHNGNLIGDDFKFMDFLESIGSIQEGSGYIKPKDFTTGYEKQLVKDILGQHRNITNCKVDTNHLFSVAQLI